MLEAWARKDEWGTRQESRLGVAVRKVVLGPRKEVQRAVSAQSVGKEGREGDKARIKA